MRERVASPEWPPAQLAVRAERHGVHAVRAGLEGWARGPAGDRVPEPDRAVGVGAGEELAVRAERHVVHARRGGEQDGSHPIGGIDGQVVRAGLARWASGMMLLVRVGNIVHGCPGDGRCGQDEGGKTSHYRAPPVHATTCMANATGTRAMATTGT